MGKKNARLTPKVDGEKPKLEMRWFLSVLRLGRFIYRIIFGDDIFISYSRSDGAAYAVALAARLKKYVCFIDQLGTPAGEQVPIRVLKKVKHASVLVVVATKGAAASAAVHEEIKTFSATGRPIIPINVDGAIRQAIWAADVTGMAISPESELARDNGNPSESIIKRISDSFIYTTRATIIKRMVIGTSIFAAASIVSLIYLLGEANNELRRSVALRLAAAGTGMHTARAAGGDVRAWQLLIAAHQIMPQRETLGALLDAHARSASLLKIIPAGRYITAVALSPDGKKVLTGNYESGDLELWDAHTGQKLAVWREGHSRPVYALAFSPDGKNAVSGSDDHTLRLWNVATGVPVGSPWRGHMREVRTLAYSPDGTRVVSGGSDQELRLWDAKTGLLLGPRWQHRHDDMIRSVSFNQQGTLVVSGGDDSRIVVWEVATGKPLVEIPKAHVSFVTAVSFAGQGDFLVVSGGADGALRTWDARMGTRVSEASKAHSLWINDIALDPTGDRVVTSGGDGRLIIWDAHSAKPITLPWTGHKKTVSSVTWSRDGSRIYSGSQDGTIRVWDAITNVLPVNDCDERCVSSVAISSDASTVLWGRYDGRLLRWTFDGKYQINSASSGHMRSVSGVVFSPDGIHVVSGSRDGVLRLWDSKTLTVKEEWQSGMPIYRMAMGPSNRIAAIGDEAGNISVWDVLSGQRIAGPWKAHKDPVMALAISPDGERIASAGLVGRFPALRFWKLNGEPVAQKSEGPWSQGAAILFDSRNKNRLVLGGKGSSLQLWDAEHDVAIGAAWEGHSNTTWTLAFSPDGAYVASGNLDNMVRLWEVATGQPIGEEWDGHGDWVYGVAFSPDGKKIVSAGVNQTLRHWIAPAAAVQAACDKLTENMSRTAWRDAVGASIAYRCTCPTLPIAKDTESTLDACPR